MDQFSTSLACGIVCLSKGITYNFSRFIFDGMLRNVSAEKKKFLMYPRFLQIIIGIETQNRTHRPIIELSTKLFASMKTGYNGAQRPLLAVMLPAGNEAADEGDKADGDNPPNPAADASTDASASAAADAGTSNDADANGSADAGDQPLPSPMPTTHDEGPAIYVGVDTVVTPPPSPRPIDDSVTTSHIHATEETLIEPSVDL